MAETRSAPVSGFPFFPIFSTRLKSKRANRTDGPPRITDAIFRYFSGKRFL